MAYQAGPLRLKGKLGDLSFYYNKEYGYLARLKGGPDKEQIAKSPKFARTRENASEFSLAVRAGQLIRRAVMASVGLTGDSKISQRLVGILVRMGKTDLSVIRGMRNPATVFNEPDSRALLRSFAFYMNRPLSSVYSGQINCDILTGSIVLTNITSETLAPASEFFRVPKGATHVRIKAAMATLDFDSNLYMIYPAPAYIAPLENPMSTTEFICEIDATDTHSRIGIVSIEFLQEKNGELYVLVDGVSLGIVG